VAEFELAVCRDLGAWDRFVESSPQGCVFASSHFLAALGGGQELLTVCENGVPILAVPALLENGTPRVLPYSFAQYAGPMFSAAVEQQPGHRRIPFKLRIVEFLLEQMAVRWPLISFVLHPAFDDLRAIQWFNYHAPEKGQFSVRLAYTGRLVLSGDTTECGFLEQVRTVRRQEFRKAESLGFTFEVCRKIDELDRLHELTFSRQGLTRAEDEVRHLRSISQAALENRFGDCFVARAATGEAASAILFLYDRDNAYYLFGANDPEFRKTGAGSWLMLMAIDHARRAGRKAVDFVGINSPNRGDFKTSFGAQPVPYFVTTWQRP